MTKLLQRMHDELVRRNYAATTIRTYLHASAVSSATIAAVASISSGRDELRRYHAYLFRRDGSSPSGPWDSTSRRSASSLSVS